MEKEKVKKLKLPKPSRTPKSEKKQRILYPYIGNRNSKAKPLFEYIAPVLRPTKLSSFIFFGLFLGSILFSVTQIDMGSFTLESESAGFEVGYPYPMFVFDVESDGLFPFNIPNLIKDTFIFLLISYVIDIAVNLYSKIKITKKEAKKKPLEFKIKQRSIAEKATDKVIGKVASKVALKIQQAAAPADQSKEKLDVPKPNDA